MRSERPATAAGYVPVQNGLFDELMPQLTDTELRVLFVVVRQTYGWREGSDVGGWRYKRRDWISHRQFVTRTGRKSEAVSKAVARLVTAGHLVAENADGVPLETASERRRYLGRIYYRVGEKWKTPKTLVTGKSKRTTPI